MTIEQLANNLNKIKPLNYSTNTTYEDSNYLQSLLPPVFCVTYIRERESIKDPAKETYYKQVWINTELNAPCVDKIELRGKNWHIDHIIPINYGFKTNIPPEIIGGLNNLQMLTKEDNFRKGARYNP